MYLYKNIDTYINTYTDTHIDTCININICNILPPICIYRYKYAIFIYITIDICRYICIY